MCNGNIIGLMHTVVEVTVANDSALQVLQGGTPAIHIKIIYILGGYTAAVLPTHRKLQHAINAISLAAHYII